MMAGGFDLLICVWWSLFCLAVKQSVTPHNA